MSKGNRLSEEKVGKLLWSFAIPAITAMLINALYSVVDRVFVGRGVGSEAIAGVMLGFPIMMVMMALGMLVGIGASASVSIYLGQKNVAAAEKAAGNAITLFIIISAAITVSGLIFLHPLLILFGASAVTLPYAETFVRIILFGTIFQSIGFGMNNVIRAEGNPFYSMVTQITGAVLNAIFCGLFIFVFKLGIAGSALATVLAQSIVSIMVLGYFYTKNSALHLHFESLKLSKAIVGRIFNIGMAPFSMQFAMAFLMGIMNTMLSRYGGDTAISAWGAINSILLLILMPIFGLNQGAQPIAGYNYGAKNFKRVRDTLKLTIFSATAIVITGFIAVQLFAPQIIAIFSKDDPALVDMGSKGIKIFLFMLPIVGFQISGSGYFQSVGKGTLSMILGLTRQVLILIPLIMILPLFFGLTGVWMAGPISDALSAIITGVFITRELGTLKLTRPETQAV